MLSMKNYLIFTLIFLFQSVFGSSLQDLVILASVSENEMQSIELYDKFNAFLDDYNSEDDVIKMWQFMSNNRDMAELICYYTKYESILDEIIVVKNWTGFALKILLSDFSIKNIINNFNTIKLLIKANGKINTNKCVVNSVLESNNIKMLKLILLIANGSINTAIDDDGNTALHISIKERLSEKFIDILLKLRASWNIENLASESPMDLILQDFWKLNSRHYCLLIINILKSHGFNYTDLSSKQLLYINNIFLKRYIINFDNIIMLWLIFSVKSIFTHISSFQK